MRETNPIEKLQRRLIELGCPARAVRKIVWETAEHWEDLKKAAAMSGVTEEEAAMRAAEQLGEPGELAERHVEALRKSSWWGRHPWLGFGVVPLFTAPITLFLSLVLGFAVGFVAIGAHLSGTPVESQLILANQPTLFVFGFGGLWTGTAVMTIMMVRKGRQAVLASRWWLMACGIISIYALFFFVLLESSRDPQHTIIGVSFFARPDRLSVADALIPWMVIALFQVRNHRERSRMLRMPESGGERLVASTDSKHNG